jgi:RNA polymerase sigma-70 factor, ECF subfamily
MVLARHRAADVMRSELRRVARQERHYRLTPAGPPGSPSDRVL